MSALPSDARARLYNTLKVPWYFEKFQFYILFICYRNVFWFFLEFPGNFCRALTLGSKMTRRYLTLQSEENIINVLWAAVRIFIVISCTVVLRSLNASIMYHHIRGQSVIKLYVVFNILEIFNKLFCSYGVDVIVNIHLSTQKLVNIVESRSSDHTLSSTSWSTFVIDFLLASTYTYLHALILLTIAFTLMVAYNSQNNALITILVSNNFVEIKSHVFKRVQLEELRKISYADVVERFHLSAALLFIFSETVTAVDEMSFSWLLSSLYVIFMIWGSELIIDDLKHTFLIKFNNYSPDIYMSFLHDLSNVHAHQSPNLDHVMGFAILPVISLICHALVPLLQNLFYMFISMML